MSVDVLAQLVRSISPRSLAVVLRAKHPEIYDWVLSSTDDSFATFTERVAWLLNPVELTCEYGRRRKFQPQARHWVFCGGPGKCPCHKESISLRSKTSTIFKEPDFTDKRASTWRNKHGVDNIQQLDEYRTASRNRRLGQKHTLARREEYLAAGYETVVSRMSTAGMVPLFTIDEYRGSSRHYVYRWRCTACNTETTSHVDYGTVARCPACTPRYVSSYERYLQHYLDTLCVEYDTNTTSVIKPLELDIYIPSHNLAIEFNGDYWHSNLKKQHDYHYKKTMACQQQGIELIHIFEYQWLSNQHAIMNRLAGILQPSELIDAQTCCWHLTDNAVTLVYNGCILAEWTIVFVNHQAHITHHAVYATLTNHVPAFLELMHAYGIKTVYIRQDLSWPLDTDYTAAGFVDISLTIETVQVNGLVIAGPGILTQAFRFN